MTGALPGQWCRVERTEGGDPGEEGPGNNKKIPIKPMKMVRKQDPSQNERR